jgi:hypothetical protein
MADVHGPHHRDRGLRRLRVVTRAVTFGAVALAGAFTALVARPHATAAKITPSQPAPVTTAPPGTLPPDTFAPSVSPTPPSPAPTAAPQPPTTLPQVTAQPAPVTSGAS